MDSTFICHRTAVASALEAVLSPAVFISQLKGWSGLTATLSTYTVVVT